MSYRIYKYALKHAFVGFVLFALFRIAFITRFGSWVLIFSDNSIFWRFIRNSLLFDAQVIAYILLPISFLSLVFLIRLNEKLFKWAIKFFSWYFVIVYTLVSLILIVDQQYYLNFEDHYNLVLFGFFKESPLILVRSICQDHPIILVITLISCIFFSLKYVSIKITKNLTEIKSAWQKVVIPLGYFLLLALALRGSVSVFPLYAEDTYISPYKEVNDCVPNAIVMLKYAFEAKRDQFELETPDEILKKNGFKNMNEVVASYLQLSPAQVTEKTPEELIFKTTPLRADSLKFNLIFIIAESWSNKLIDYDSDRMNLLCTMKKHLKDDILFRHFQSATNGTINTLEDLITCTPYKSLFTSRYRHLSFPTSIAEPFYKNNYQTEFITGIELSWRNIFDVLPRQKFMNVTGKFKLLSDYPEAKCNSTWGVYDHEMLKYVFMKLQKQSAPSFFMCLTSTNHTPFEFPDDFPLPEIRLTSADMTSFNLDKKIVEKYLKGFQYTNKALGDFMDAIKSSPFASNTIVVITGDHNVRLILKYKGENSKSEQFAVPLYIYLPPILRKTIHADTIRYGSHHDIIPTLAPILFNNTQYPGLGQNLFDQEKPNDSYYSIHEEKVLHGKALTDDQAMRIAKAREVILKLYFYNLFAKSKNNN